MCATPSDFIERTGWPDIATLMQKDTFFTIFIKTELEEPVKTALCDLWLNLEQAPTVSQRTEDTYTSSTPATTTTAHVGATSPRSSGAVSENGWLANALAHETCQSKDGVLSQFIRHHTVNP
nr:PREDICTED: uncharacterized protein LOC109040521 [Bemisia tabaci]